MTYTYIISIEFSHMMNDYMVHMVYTSFVFICMYIYVAEHRRPRSPMRFYVYGGAPPPSFTHVYKHIYGGVEHRHSRHTALSRGLVDQHSYYHYR